MFHVPRINGITLCVFLSFVQLQLWDYLPATVIQTGSLKQAIFRAPFLAPSFCHGGEEGNGCSVTLGAAEFHYCFNEEITL